MKLLHIGKKGNIENYAPKDSLRETMDIVDLPPTTPVPELLCQAADAHFIIADAMATLPADLILNMPNLMLIHSEGVGYNFFDLEAADARGVYVCNCKGMNAAAVAEQTILLMLGVLKDIRGGDQSVREATQIITKENYMARGNLLELSDLTIGLYGFGDIAKATAQLLHALKATVFYYSRHQADEATEASFHVRYLPEDELLASSDMLSLHIPANPQTNNLVNDAFLSRMKDGAYLINTSRGELVDSAALVRALRSGKIYRAGLDTIAGEPVKKDNILINQPGEIASRILFSPHIAGITASSFRRGYEIAWGNIQRITQGLAPIHVVNHPRKG